MDRISIPGEAGRVGETTTSAGRERGSSNSRRTSEADATEEVPDLDLGGRDRRRRGGRWRACTIGEQIVVCE
jgi:hypothetical protein